MVKKINNKSSRPDNIVIRDHMVIEECEHIESELPPFMRDYFVYLRGSVAPTTRRAYLHDIKFFCDYLIETDLFTNAENPKDILLEEFNEIKARDVNLF